MVDLKKLLDTIEREAKKRNAPAFKFKAKNPYESLIMAILSSRTRDEVTIEIGKRLLSKAPNPETLAKLDIKEIEDLIRGLGFYRVKARKLKELAEIIVNKYKSKIPLKFEELIKLPGVGRKTANIVISAFGGKAIAVDTHVHRIANRIGLVDTEKPEETEEELKKLFPEELWNRVNKAFVGFGQTICKPRKPLCNECPIRDICKSYKLKR